MRDGSSHFLTSNQLVNMHHLIWVIIHFIAYLVFPEYGPSVTLVVYISLELFLKMRNDLRFELIHIFFLGTLITVIANMNIIYAFNTGSILDSYGYAIPKFFPLASLVFALGTQIMAFGYFWNSGVSFPKLYLNLKLSKNILAFIFFLGLAFALKGFWFFVNLPGSLQTIIDLIPLIAIFILSQNASKLKINFLFVRSIILTLVMVFNAVLYSYLRIEILLPIMVFLLGYFLGSGSIKALISLKFIPIVIVMILFYTFFEVFGERRENLTSGLGRINQLTNAYTEDKRFGKNEEASLSAFERSSNISQISAVCGLVNSYGFYNGKASAPLLLAFIPRVLWPEKPKIALGVWFAVEIGFAVKTDNWYNNSINMTIPGHLFLDFGWIGLVIGSFLIGFFIRLLWDTVGFYKPKFNLLGTFFGVYLLFTSFIGLGADLQILVTFFALYLILYILSKIFSLKNEDTLYRTNPQGK